MSKILTAIAVLVLGTSFTVRAQHQHPSSHDSEKIAGNWQLSMESRHGKLGGVLKIQQDGSKLEGICEIENHGSNPLTGTIDGKKVVLNVSIGDGHMTFKFNGTVDGAKMSGSTEPHGAAWTATRQ